MFVCFVLNSIKEDGLLFRCSSFILDIFLCIGYVTKRKN